ncbi:MAG: helicase-related protein [Terriglobia bacterium]
MRSIEPDYAKRIKTLRAGLGLTQSEFAALIGVSYASVNRWENEQSEPSALAWQRIVAAEASRSFDAASDAPSLEFGKTESPQAPESLRQVDFCADPEIVRLVAEGERLTYGHLFNPAFATEISCIDPLPHQRIAVYGHMLSQTRLRFLLADDAGAGKTIMAGLYVREMLNRRLIHRVLIVPPAGLVGNWEREMKSHFSLPFTVVTGNDARFANPFSGADSSFVIVSVDTLASDRMFSRLSDSSVLPYDLVIFDEAHKLSASREPDLRVRKTDRYRLAEALAGIHTGDERFSLNWSCQHLLLLTATPHMGKDFPYYSLWRLLEPEILSTVDAFNAYPPDARQRHFIRRTKEEMVRFDGTPLYPTRISDTFSYDLSQGEVSEQSLYDDTTNYIQTYYNRARILNRSAARLAMSIFQRRLASSTYALMRSFERRLQKLGKLIEDVQSGRLSLEELTALQRKLGDEVQDVLSEKTGDEETAEGEQEENEAAEEQAMGGVVAVSLAELEAERIQVERLLGLARKVNDAAGEESKFKKLCEVLRSDPFRDAKLIIFTEHRDTLDFLVRRLEGLGFTGQVARIHGGMDYREREEQVEFFRKPASQGGATYLVATEAAGEGINLQFCWLIVNYDIPWNPARLEQRMGRIHRYGQKHDPVFIVNLVAGKTREGRVLKTLLDKLERIRKELRSDKVFDVIGRVFEGVSLRQYLEQSVTEEGAAATEQRIEGRLTKEQVLAIAEREKRLFGDGGDVRTQLQSLKASMEKEELRRLLPGYVRRFVEKAAPFAGIDFHGDPGGFFSFRTVRPGALDILWPVLEVYSPEERDRLTFYRPEDSAPAVWLHPGEPVFDQLRAYTCERFRQDAMRGAVFVDPTAHRPYLFHIAMVSAMRKEDASVPALAGDELLDCRLVAFQQEEGEPVAECPVERLLLLKGSRGVPLSATKLAAAAKTSREEAQTYAADVVARSMADTKRSALVTTLPEREDFVRRGFDYQDAELAARRTKVTDKARAGDPRAKGELTQIRERQRSLAAQMDSILSVMRREPELIVPGEVKFLAHALVVPSDDPEDRKRYDEEVEALAVRMAWAYEESLGAHVKDVSTAKLAVSAGLTAHPGFDLLSRRDRSDELAIEVKGRAGEGDVEVTENEWAKACNLRERYWLYVAYDCGGPRPRLFRVRDPFGKLLATARGGVIIDEQRILAAAEANK